MSFNNKKLFFVICITIAFVAEECCSKPIPINPNNPSTSKSGCGTKRASSFSNLPSSKRVCKKKTKRDPFSLKTCKNVENIYQLKTLAKVNFAKEQVYGYVKEHAEPMFKNQICPIYSLSNDESIYASLIRISNKIFFSLDSSKNILYRKIMAIFGHYDDQNDNYIAHYHPYSNIRSYISYFIFTVPLEIEPIIAKLKNTNWDQPFSELSEEEYQLLKSNLIYTGSGQPSRPFKHIINTYNILSGQLLPKGFSQRLHWYLAKGVLQNHFTKILIVPFFGCTNYPACLYSEQATIWSHKNQTMNNPQLFELAKFQHKLCVERSKPELYIKNCLSTQALQFVSDRNVETGIRQIGQFGVIYDFKGNKDQFDWSKQIRLKKEPFINSAFQITKSTTNFFKFGNLKFTSAFEIVQSDFFQDEHYWIFPYKQLNFVFTKNDWIERIRFSNEIKNFMNSAISAFPVLLKAINKEIKWVCEAVEAEEFSPTVFENNIQKTPNGIKLLELINEFRVYIEIARNYNQLGEKMVQCQNYASQRIQMFEASLEFLLFKTLIFDNKNVIYAGDTTYDTSQIINNLEIPEKFLNLKYHIQSFRPKINPPPGKSKAECPYCGHEILNDLDYHMDVRRGAKNYVCDVCRLEFKTKLKQFINHRSVSPGHRLLSIGQSVPNYPHATNDPIIAPFACPLHSDEDSRNFVLEENCLEHIKAHDNADQISPKNRLEGKSALSVYTCRYCGFKTNVKKFAEHHLRSVHSGHLDYPQNVAGIFNWKEYFTEYFDVDCKNDPVIKGNFRCKLEGESFSSKQNAVSHFFGPSHRAQFKQASIGIKVKGISKEIGEKVVALLEKYKEKDVSHQIKPKEGEFLFQAFVDYKRENNKWFFWRYIEKEGGKHKLLSSDCYGTRVTAEISIYPFVKTEFFKHKEYADPVIRAFKDWANNPKWKEEGKGDKRVKNKMEERGGFKDLNVGLELIASEMSKVVKHSVFRKFIKEKMKLEMIDSRKIEDKSTIAADCNDAT